MILLKTDVLVTVTKFSVAFKKLQSIVTLYQHDGWNKDSRRHQYGYFESGLLQGAPQAPPRVHIASRAKVPISQHNRACFHPGVSALARETSSLGDNAPQITSKDMLQAMLSYIWPKVRYFVCDININKHQCLSIIS